MKQFSTLIAKIDFTLKLEGQGRPCRVSAGDSFTVTNPEHMQHKGIKIMREKGARLDLGYLLTLEQIDQLFTVQG